MRQRMTVTSFALDGQVAFAVVTLVTMTIVVGSMIIPEIMTEATVTMITVVTIGIGMLLLSSCAACTHFMIYCLYLSCLVFHVVSILQLLLYLLCV